MARKTKQDVINENNIDCYLMEFQTCLREATDPRRAQGKRYSLESIILTALLASICGAEDAQAFETWGETRRDLLETFLDLPHGTPTQDVFLRFFASFDPAQFSAIYSKWIEILLELLPLKSNDNHIAIDGKTSRRSGNNYKKGQLVHTVSAWSTMRGMVLAQVDCDWKSNEMKVIPELLAKLDLKNSTVTIDAGGIYKEVIDAVVDNGGHYVVAVKNNQPTLYNDIINSFSPELQASEPKNYSEYESIDKGHGRIETRKCTICKSTSLISHKKKWQSAACLIAVSCSRTIIKSDKTTHFTRYFITNHTDLSAEESASFVRKHWGIENGLHWILDMAFDEDQARHRAENCAKNMAILRHFALTMLKNEKTKKLGVANKRKLSGWDDDYLMKVLLLPREFRMR